MYGTRSQISREVGNSSSGSHQPLNEHSPGFQNDHFPTWGFFKVGEVPRRTGGHYVRASHCDTAHLLADTPTTYIPMQQLPSFWRPCYSTVVTDGYHLVHHIGGFQLLVSPHKPFPVAYFLLYMASSWLDIGINNEIQFPFLPHLPLLSLACFSFRETCTPRAWSLLSAWIRLSLSLLYLAQGLKCTQPRGYICGFQKRSDRAFDPSSAP